MKNIKFIIQSVFFGLLDTIFPSFEKSIETLPSDFINDEPKVIINWLRFFTSLIIYTILILNLFGLITIEQIITIIQILFQ